MTTTPLLTIITICYNVKAAIAPTLHSLAGQRNQSFEYLIIDGASQDKTFPLAQTLCPRVIAHSEPDHELYDAMNKGLHQAHGTYIWYLNAGDTLRASDTIRTVYAALETYQPDLLYGDTMIVDGIYQDLHPRRLRPPHQLTQRSFASGILVCHQAFIPRRSLAPLYDPRHRYSADYGWCIKIINTIHSRYRIDDYLASYLNGGVTTRNHRASLLKRLHTMARRYGWSTALTRHVSSLFCRQR